jgi:mannosyltransferase OCH1-like enzyme
LNLNSINHENNIFIYWTGKEYSLIRLLRKIIYAHSENEKYYKVNLITSNNILEYINFVPEYFNLLNPAHQADFVRVNVICDHGGIWLDSDTLVMDNLSSLFKLIFLIIFIIF